MDFVEQNCTITHAGRDYTAGGAVATDAHLIAYPGDNGILQDWHGSAIGTYRIISTRPAVFFGRRSWQGSTYHYMRATLADGRTYSLRGFGKGMIARGRRCKRK